MVSGATNPEINIGGVAIPSQVPLMAQKSIVQPFCPILPPVEKLTPFQEALLWILMHWVTPHGYLIEFAADLPEEYPQSISILSGSTIVFKSRICHYRRAMTPPLAYPMHFKEAGTALSLIGPCCQCASRETFLVWWQDFAILMQGIDSILSLCWNHCINSTYTGFNVPLMRFSLCQYILLLQQDTVFWRWSVMQLMCCIATNCKKSALCWSALEHAPGAQVVPAAVLGFPPGAGRNVVGFCSSTRPTRLFSLFLFSYLNIAYDQ